MQSEENNTQRAWRKSFVRTLRPQIYLFLVFLFVFGSIMLFTHIPATLYFYGVLLALFFWSLSLVFQWIHYKRRLKHAEHISISNLQSFEDSIEEGEALSELHLEKYEELAKQFHEYRQSELERSREQMDYFTLWLHQIKTPIAAISLILQRQEEQFAGQKQLEQELIRLDDYTHMALNYLKLEEPGKEMDLEEIVVDEVIKETIKKYAILFIYNDLQVDFKPSGLSVLTDRKWLQVLVEQILSNSLKYTKKGTIKVYIDDSSLFIEDTGTGIRKEDLPRIFEKGYTGLDGRLHEKSTGLGLFLSRKICDRLGHTLTIDSEVGKGTKVEINFEREALKIFD